MPAIKATANTSATVSVTTLAKNKPNSTKCPQQRLLLREQVLSMFPAQCVRQIRRPPVAATGTGPPTPCQSPAGVRRAGEARQAWRALCAAAHARREDGEWVAPRSAERLRSHPASEPPG